jgi:hypothetical protein
MEGHDGYDNGTTINDVLDRNDQRSLDSGDVELGTIVPSPVLQLAQSSAVVSGSHIARPIIHRGNSKSGIVNNVATGKEEVRVQSAWVCSMQIFCCTPILHPLFIQVEVSVSKSTISAPFIDCIDPIGTFANGTTTT